MNRLILGVLVLAVAYFCVDKFVFAPRRDVALVAATTQSAKTEAFTEARRQAATDSIAVLPFVNMSDDKDNQYFSDGISEELLNVLVHVNGLSVASRTSSFAYRDTTLGTQAIGRALNVGHVLEGSVRKSGNMVRITAQLIDAVNDRPVWSKTYDRELTDIFVIQEQIANAIVDALRDTMAAHAAEPAVKVRASTQNMQAYELYLKAREKFIARSDLPGSVALFERAVKMDPEFARGWEGLAAVSVVAPSWNLADRDYNALARQAAERALQLDPTLSMPWAVMGQLEESHWPADYTRELAYLDKAIAADPKNATAYLWRGITWMQLGFFDKSIADTERCLALEPGYANCTRHKALDLLFEGKEAAAIEWFDLGLGSDSLGSRSDSFVAPVLARGDRTGAILLVQGMEPALLQTVLHALAHPEQPVPDVHQLVARDAANPDWGRPARVALWLRNYDRVADIDTAGLPSVVPWERYPPTFRNSPGMKRLVQNMGVTAYWRTHGFPPQCHARQGVDFSCD
jgi:TolB-like protein